MSKDEAAQWKAAGNKNIKKLRAVSMVCGLAKSWQHWISENERKHASEPSGWSPCHGESSEEPQKIWITNETEIEDGLQHKVASKEIPTLLDFPEERTKDQYADNSEIKMSSSSITMKMVIKTAGPKDRNTGMKLLTKKIEGEDVGTKFTLDTVGSEMVLSQFQTEKQIKLKQKSGKDGCPAEEHSQFCAYPKVDAHEGEDHATKYSPSLDAASSKMVLSHIQPEIQIEHEKKPVSDGSPEEEHSQIHAYTKEDINDSTFERQVLNMNNEDSLSGSSKICDGESSVKIKCPQILACRRNTEQACKISALSKKCSSVGKLKSRWQNWATEHTDNQKLNPFSEYFDFDYSMSLRLQKGQDGYGHPKEGSKTAERAKRAEKHIHGEIADMCYVIRTMADPDQDGKTRVTFGELFDRYVRISDKVVGILLRARKHGKVHFEGEMLWQGQDDGVIITLLV
ncbi:actin binding Rho activating protein b [Stigmatopora argus]